MYLIIKEFVYNYLFPPVELKFLEGDSVLSQGKYFCILKSALFFTYFLTACTGIHSL